MPEEQSPTRGDLLARTAEIVAAHLSNNATSSGEVPALIQSVFDKLLALTSEDDVRRDRAHAGGADQALGDRRLHRLPGRRQEAEDAEAPPDDQLRHDARSSIGRSGA